MKNHDIVTKLSLLQPPEVIYEIKFESVLAVIVNRLGHEALALSVEDLDLARDEVIAAIEHHDPARDLIAIGLDSWEIVRNL